MRVQSKGKTELVVRSKLRKELQKISTKGDNHLLGLQELLVCQEQFWKSAIELFFSFILKNSFFFLY